MLWIFTVSCTVSLRTDCYVIREILFYTDSPSWTGKAVINKIIDFPAKKWREQSRDIGAHLACHLLRPLKVQLYILSSDTRAFFVVRWRRSACGLKIRRPNDASTIPIFKNRTEHATPYSLRGHVVNAPYDIQKHRIRHWPCTF